jgi:tetratricopeptide (TPR) repeat protein
MRMLKQMTCRWMLVLVAMLCVARPLNAQSTQPSPEEIAANAALAERLAQMAQTSLSSGKSIVPATLRQSAALLETASRLNPTEPRFLRLLTEAYLQLGGDDGRAGAISSLNRYVKIEPNDQAALLRVIDLYYAGLETADKCKGYVEQMLGMTSLPPEVRSHVAVLGARLSLDRSESDRANEYIEQALQLFPLSPEALRMKYQLTPPDAPPAQRVALLLQMIRSNPSNPGAMSELSARLADAGLVDPAINWAQTSLTVAQRLGQQPNFGQITALASEYVIADQLQTAQQLIGRLIEVDPTNADATFLALLIEKRGGNAEKIKPAADKVQAAVVTRLSRISDEMNGREPQAGGATTQPNTNVDIAADLKKLGELNNTQLSGSYAASLADLAWLELYFNGSSAGAAPYIQALQTVLPEDSPTLARLQGWSLLVDGKKDEARVKLSAVADRDPLAMLGILRLDSAEQSPDKLTAAAKKVLADHASGLVGAVLIEGLRDKVGLMPPGPSAPFIRAELEKFPREWLEILDFTKAKNFYNLKADPLKVGHSFGEPILARISITNTGKYDLTIGPEGAIRQDVWIDVTIKGMAPTSIPGVAFERMGQKLVIKPKESIAQIVRVDQDGLAQYLAAKPTIQVPLYFSLLTNPLTQATGIAPGPGGYRQQFTRVVERGSAPLSDQTLNAQFQKLQQGTGDERVRAVEELGTFAALLKSMNDPQAQGKANEITDVVRKSTADPIPSVRAEATFVTAMLADPAVRDGMVRQMLGDREFIVRIIGLAAAQQTIPPDKRKELVAPLAPSTQPTDQQQPQQPGADADAETIVKQMALSVMEVADLPPTSQPSTQPAGEITAGTGAGTP